MIDYSAVIDTAISPVVTLPVIAVAAAVIVAQWAHTSHRLKKQRKFWQDTTGRLVAGIVLSASNEMDRRVKAAISLTYDNMKAIGFDKLAKGTVTRADLDRVDAEAASKMDWSKPEAEAFHKSEGNGSFRPRHHSGFDDHHTSPPRRLKRKL